MGNGYSIPAHDAFDGIDRRFAAIERAVRELQAADGSQLFNAFVELRKLVNNLAAEVAAVSASGATWEGPVTTTGRVEADTGLRSDGVYNNTLSSGYRAVWVTNVNGDLGYVPSSRRFKRDIESAPTDLEAALALRVVTYRYKAAVEALDDDAPVEWGVIAEELHDLGLTWAVDYDDDGLPFGVRYDRLVLALIPVLQDHESRIAALEAAS